MANMRYYEFKKGYVRVWFDNGKCLFVNETIFVTNYQDFYDLTFEQIRKKHKTILIGNKVLK